MRRAKIPLRQKLAPTRSCLATRGMKQVFLSGLLGILLVSSAWAGPAGVAGSRPNIVLIVADDLGHGHLGSYGQDKIRTPHINRLAAEGMRFTNAYAGSAVCAPSRSVLMTGQHTGHTPVRTNGADNRLNPADFTVAEMLKAAGYATGGFGKWGLGQQFTTGRAYDQGFDLWVGQYDQVHAHFYYPWYIWRNNRRILLLENEGGGRGHYVHDVIHQHALTFIREHKDRPFFAYLSYLLPHVELVVPEEDEKPYSRKGWPQVAIPDPREGYIGSHDAYVTYAGMISRLDRHVGEVITLVDRLGLKENTLIIFTSDNGAQGDTWKPLQDFFNGAGGLRGLKGELYEGGIRVPMIARWPGKIKAGSVRALPTCLYDFMPTLAQLAGIAAPVNTDGVSLLPTLLGTDGQQRHRYLYWEHQAQTAVRAGRWKAIRPSRLDAWELYDLSTDESETTNVAQKKAMILARLVTFARVAHTAPRPMPIIPPAVYRDFVR